MDVSRDELTTRFKEFSDQELVDRLEAGTFTPVAIEVAIAELRSRGIELSPAVEAQESDAPFGVEIAPPEGDFVTVAEFWDPVEANLLRTLLASAGVYVHLWGEHLGIAHIFLSVASGGTKVQVPENQVKQAREIIAAFKRGELTLDEAPE